MAIQNRRGKEADFDPSKMLPGEFAVTTDGSRKVYAAFAPGDVKELASKEEVQGIVDDFKENVDKQTEEVVQAIDDKGKEVIDRIPDYDTKISTLQQSKATAIVSTLKGETLVTNSSAAIPPRNLKLFGKSWQVRTQGNQLFDCNNYSENDVTGNGDIRPSVIIPVEAGNYTISRGNASDINIYFRKIINGDYGVGTPVNQNTTHSISLESDGNIIVYTDAGGELSLAIDIMVNKGTIALPYEPYTGRMPSPSIDYPQEIQSLGYGGSIGGKLIGENLIDIAGIYVTNWGVYQENGTRITVDEDKVTIEVLKESNGIKIPLLKPSKTFYCSLNYTFSDGAETNTRPFTFRTENGHVYSTNQLPGTVIQLFAGEPIYSIEIGAGSSVNHFAVGTTITLSQSYLNETGNGFTPYIATQSFAVLTPNGLPGIPVSSGGNYTDSNGQQYVADYVDLERGKYVKNVFRVNMTPDLPWKYINTVNNHNHNFQIRLNVNDFPKATTRYHYVIGQLFSHFRYVDVSWDDGRFSNGAKAYFYDDELTISFEQDSEINSLETWKQFITDNDVYGEYILAEPIETDLTAEEIAQYKSLCMNYPNTTIINDENAYMEVEYVEDTELYLAGNYVPISEHNALESRVSALEQMALN